MTVRRTKQAETILELRLALADAGRVRHTKAPPVPTANYSQRIWP
jgi:hypothetical protein